MPSLLRSDFPATYIPTAFDLRAELVQLNKLARRSSAAVAKQIEEYVESIWLLVQTGSETAQEPDATVPATTPLRGLYSDFTDFTRAVRIKVDRLLALSDNTEVRTAVAEQLKTFLIYRGWTIGLAGAVVETNISNAGAFVGSDGTHAFTQASTSGSGTGVAGTVTISGGVVVSVQLLAVGSGYAASDTVTCLIVGVVQTVACVLTVSSVLS